MAQVHLIRHGQASFDSDDYDQLSPLGEQQAHHVGTWFGQCAREVRVLHRGSLKRHRQTAEQFLEGLPAPLRPADDTRIDAGFDEYDHEAIMLAQRPDFANPGALKAWAAAQPYPRRAFQAMFAEAMQRWMSGAHDAEYPESWPVFRTRCVVALRGAIETSDGARTIAIVTSGGPISAICQTLLGLTDASAGDLCFGLANSGVTTLFHSGGKVSLGTLNSIAHLESKADAALITYR